jgi:hypothetical protein
VCACRGIKGNKGSVQLEDMLLIGCDIELKLDDATMPASSVALRMMSDVFNNALNTQIFWGKVVLLEVV